MQVYNVDQIVSIAKIMKWSFNKIRKMPSNNFNESFEKLTIYYNKEIFLKEKCEILW